jgi:hypothetical protein
VKFFIPEMAKAGSAALPRCTRCLKGWSILCPGQQRLPFPMVALCAVMALELSMGEVSIALALLLCFRCYLRPGEFQRLRVNMLIRSWSPRTLWSFGLLLHPSEEGMRSKVGMQDETIYLDTDPWMQSFLHLLLEQPADHQLLNLAPGKLKLNFLASCRSLGLEDWQPCLYQLRHGGASHDLMHGERRLEEVKRRGRWSCDS